jgi:hypothetical protein
LKQLDSDISETLSDSSNDDKDIENPEDSPKLNYKPKSNHHGSSTRKH